MNNYKRILNSLLKTYQNPIYILGRFKYYDISDAVNLLLQESDFKRTISERTIRSKVNEILLNDLKSGKQLSEKDIGNFIDYIKSKYEKEEWDVFRPIFGAKLELPQPMKLGKYTFYNTRLHKSWIEVKERFNIKDDFDRELLRYIFGNFDDGNFNDKDGKKVPMIPDVVVKVEVTARDHRKALELADVKFEHLINAIRFVLTDVETANRIGVIDQQYYLIAGACVARKGGRWSINFSNSKHDDINLDSLLSDEFKELWNILSKSSRNEIEDRIFLAVQWIGKAIEDFPDLQKSFPQLMFAYEALFSKKNEPIASRIAEFCAYIAGENMSHRLEIYRKVNHFYRKRSDVVHGRVADISKGEFISSVDLLRNVIKKMLSTEILRKSEKKLDEWFFEKKFN